jgi:HEAT repeat protein
VGALLIFFATRANEPTYGGQSLSYWLERLWHSDDKVRLEAEAAIRSMGTNAVPHLIRMLPERDAAWRIEFSQTWDRAGPLLLRSRSRLAAHGLGIIGPSAREAVPFLIQNMTNHPGSASSPSPYEMALGDIGAASIRPLMQVLSHPDPYLQTCAWSALRGLGTNLIPVVPELITILNSSDADTRAKATYLLGYVSGDARTISALTQCLNDNHETVRFIAVQSLSWHGPNAKAALPALLQALIDKDTNVQTAARIAISDIDTNLTVEGNQIRRKMDLR